MDSAEESKRLDVIESMIDHGGGVADIMLDENREFDSRMTPLSPSEEVDWDSENEVSDCGNSDFEDMPEVIECTQGC